MGLVSAGRVVHGGARATGGRLSVARFARLRRAPSQTPKLTARRKPTSLHFRENQGEVIDSRSAARTRPPRGPPPSKWMVVEEGISRPQIWMAGAAVGPPVRGGTDGPGRRPRRRVRACTGTHPRRATARGRTRGTPRRPSQHPSGPGPAGRGTTRRPASWGRGVVLSSHPAATSRTPSREPLWTRCRFPPPYPLTGHLRVAVEVGCRGQWPPTAPHVHLPRQLPVATRRQLRGLARWVWGGGSTSAAARRGSTHGRPNVRQDV